MNVQIPLLDELYGAWDRSKDAVAENFSSLGSQIQSAWLKEHNADNTHGTVTCTGSVTSASYGTFDQPRFRVYKTATQSIPDVTSTVVTWNVPTSPSGSLTAGYLRGILLAATGVATIQTSGIYALDASLNAAGGAGAGGLRISAFVGGGVGEIARIGGVTSDPQIMLHITVPLAAGDTIWIEYYHNAGVPPAMNVGGSALTDWWSLVKVS